MPCHSGNLPLYELHENLQNLLFLEEIGSQNYRSAGGGVQAGAPASAQRHCGRRKIHSAPLRSKLMQMFV